MSVDFTLRQSFDLFRMLAETSTDVLLKTDREGYIVHAAPALERVGLRLPGEPARRHLRDVVGPAFAAAVMAEHDTALADRRPTGPWIEFSASAGGGREAWFEIQTRCLVDRGGEVGGAVSIVRSIDERRTYEERLFAAAMTDPLTGLTNRSAFIAMLRHLAEQRTVGCLAIFGLDHFKSVNLRYGHSAGDEVLVAFAELLRILTRSDDILSRIGGESFGVILPGTSRDQAQRICGQIVATLAELNEPAGARSLTITASAGIAEIAGSLDDTVRRAELALVRAKANGRNRVELDRAAARAA
ncbi:MAG TPA: sensor domain-containing diguanylate cyclase [Novosphingobium sp.]|nr:sensor domain-containing diguanylate cyclase [Novosphingobium sp.]